jgi:hypothetical protein
MLFPDFTPTVSALIRELAVRHGDRPLIVLGDRRLSYADAERQSAVLARGLLATGVGKGTRIGIWMPNGPDWVLAWLAAARIGALVVPINTFFRARELRFVLQHADVSTLLCISEFAKQDRLATLEEAAPELVGRGPGPLFLTALPYLRAVRVWGPASRPWASEGRTGLTSASEMGLGVSDDVLRAVEQAVSPSEICGRTIGSTRLCPSSGSGASSSRSSVRCTPGRHLFAKRPSSLAVHSNSSSASA